jgi:eukaryotic-like serine/threonine-protein kinase
MRSASSARGDVERLYQAARKIAPEERESWVRREAGGRPQFAEEVLSLLAHGEAAESFFLRLRARLRTEAAAAPGATTDSRSAGVEVALAPGSILGRYRVLEQIASGGMGTVYRAHDAALDREVALKVLSDHLSLDPEARGRFFLEARAAAALDHPHVCTIYEVGEDGSPFLAMPLYRGETLKQRIAHGALPVAEALGIAQAIAEGLGAAHARGVVHRDVKPGNVMLTRDGGVKLLDFGIATVAAHAAPRSAVVAGTLPYMAPETARGSRGDARSDLWSLGVVIFEMLAGARPFNGPDDLALLKGIIEGEPESLGPGIPAGPTELVERLLRKDPDDRARSAESVAREIAALRERAEGRDEWEMGAPVRSFPTALRSISRRPVLLALVFLFLVGVGVAVGDRGISGRADGTGPAGLPGMSTVPEGPVGPAAPTVASVAVLPFSFRGDQVIAPLVAAGMTEALIELLHGFEELRVIASTSVWAFRDQALDVRSIAESLGVGHVVEGSVDGVGSRLRLRVRLVSGRDGGTLWSETYDRDYGDIFQIQDEIARAVAAELGLRLMSAPGVRPPRQPTRNLAAFESFLRGNDPSLVRNLTTAEEALQHFRLAIALDSAYAAAWAGLARLHLRVGLGHDAPGPAEEHLRSAEEAVRRALTLDASLASAHTILGTLQMMDANPHEAERHLRRAIELAPASAQPRESLAGLNLWMDRPVEALDEARRAFQLDPLSPTANAELARALQANDQCEEALSVLERIRPLDPPLLRTATIGARCHLRMGSWNEAEELLRPQAEQGGPMALALLGLLRSHQGDLRGTEAVLDGLLERWRIHGRGALPVAIVKVGLGDIDEAFEWLDRAIDDRTLRLDAESHLLLDPAFQALHQDPRFQPLRERLGLQNL